MAVNKTMLFGPIGRQVEVPWPLSGMGSDVNLYTETTELLSGEVSVYRAPVTYKTYNMSWKTSSQKLQPMIDVYSGVYGRLMNLERRLLSWKVILSCCSVGARMIRKC